MTKDEMKDEMKDKISMALKDSVLQQGFEIICKTLQNLKKKNANYLVLFKARTTCGGIEE